VKGDPSGGILAGALAQVVEDKVAKGEKGQGPAPHYCSDPTAGAQFGAYRNGDDDKRYLIAVGRCGRRCLD
jgi:hypothetical protein